MTDWSRTSTDIMSAVYNAKRANTNKWRTARGCVRAGRRNARILLCGNSITAGFGATGNGSGSNMASKTYPTFLAQALSAAGLNASWQNFIGGNNYADFTAADSRINMGGWVNAGLGSFGANVLMKSTITGAPMSFTPLTPVDTVEVLATRNLAGVAITIAVDGGATLATYNPFASGSLQIGSSGPISLGSLGLHTIQANLSSNTQTFLIGIIAYNSTQKEVSVLRGGWNGAVASDFNNVNWTYTDGIKVAAPDLSLLGISRNDPGNATALPAYTASLQSIIDACKLSGDVGLLIEPLGNLAPATFAPYGDALYHLAQLNDLFLIDSNALWDGYANTVAWYGDGIHPNDFSYAELGYPLGDILLRL
jgi:hypothetical protein